MEIKEGYMPFMGYQTYYRIVGKTEEGKSPIILLHGGPGSTHNYFELLDRVAESGRAVYDGIQDSKWHLFVGARHMPFAEQNDEYCKVLEEWMEEKEGK